MSENQRLYHGLLRDYSFPLPPIAEQERIAEMLAAMDEAYQKVSEAQAKLSALKRVAFARLLSGTDAGSDTTPSPIGKVPKSWDVVRIGEAGEVLLGRQRAPQYQTGVYTKPYLRVANVFDGYLDLSDVLEMDFDPGDFARFVLRPGDILLNEGQSRELVGRCAVFNGEIKDCCFQNTLVRFRAGERLLPEFAFVWLQYAFHKGVFAAIASQTTSIAHLGAERFARLFMPVPPKNEQERISRAASDIVAEEKRISSHLERLRRVRTEYRESRLAGRGAET